MMSKSYILIFFLFFFGLINAQTYSTNSENDIFYSESELVQKNTNSFSNKSNNLNLNKDFFDGFLNNKKPFFLTRKSGKLNYYNISSDEFVYSFIYKLESNDPNELRSVPLDFKQVLYPVKLINDTIVQVESKTDTYFLSTKKALEYGEINEFPIEFSDSNLDPIVYYFKKLNNKTDINNLIKCYVDAKLDEYDWLNEFVKYDFSINITKKIAENIKSYQFSYDSFYKEFKCNFGMFNFGTNKFNVSLNKLLKQSHFFDNDFKNNIYIKNPNNNPKWVNDNFEFNCSNDEARQITNLFDFDRNAIIKLELEYNNRLNSCDCNSCDYQNDFVIKSLVITSLLNKEIKVKITID